MPEKHSKKSTLTNESLCPSTLSYSATQCATCPWLTNCQCPYCLSEHGSIKLTVHSQMNSATSIYTYAPKYCQVVVFERTNRDI